MTGEGAGEGAYAAPFATPVPQAAPPPGGRLYAPRPRMPRRRKVLIGVTVAFVVIAGVVGGLIGLTALVEKAQAGPAAPTTRLTGELYLADSATEEAECIGQGENGDLHPGATVRVRSGEGEPLAEGRLGDPVRDPDLGTCTYPFVVDGIPRDEQVYVVLFGQRGADYTRNQLDEVDWDVFVEVGTE